MKFSVIIPVYNVSCFLPKCIDSILFQTYQNFELILVNDGSTDNSLEICKMYAGKNKKITVINKENGGLSSSRNAGLKYATGEYILFLDSDDYVEKNLLEVAVKNLQKNKVDLLLYGYYRDTEENGRLISSIQHQCPNFLLNNQYEIMKLLFNMKKNAITDSAVTKLYKTEIIKKYNITFPENELYEDIEFNFELFPHICSMQSIEHCFLHYMFRKDHTTITNRFNNNKYSILTKRCYSMKKSIDKLNITQEQRCFFYGEISYWYFRYCLSYLMDLYFYKGLEHLKKEIRGIKVSVDFHYFSSLPNKKKTFMKKIFIIFMSKANSLFILNFIVLMSKIKFKKRGQL